VVSVSIDADGIRYQGKSIDRPYAMVWAEVAGWRANSFTSSNPARTPKPGRANAGDFGVGIYQGSRYISFRTRSGRDYLAAVKVLRKFASAKERSGE